MGSAHRAGWFRGEFYMPLPGAAKTVQPGFAQGGRRLAVRTAMEHPIGALLRTPFPASRDFPSRGNEKIGGTGYCVTYDTDSQSRNVLASPLGEEGHEVAKECTRVRIIMILNVDVTAERRHYNTHRPRGRYHNPRPEGPSNLRTLRPSGRSILRTFPSEPFEPSEPSEPGPQSGPIPYCFFPPAMLELAGTKSAENAIGNFYARKFL